MANENNIKTLQFLAQYVIDGTFIVAQAMASLSNKMMREKLSTILEEYEQNIKTLSDILVKHGGGVPDHTRDFKGFFMQGYTGMRGLISDQGVIHALSTNTKMLADAFEKALTKEPLPSHVTTKLENMLHHTRQHVKYFESNS